MEEKKDILEHLDDACKNLLFEIEKHVSIDFVVRNDAKKECDFQVLERDVNRIPTKARIRYYEPIEPCKIAHELLHAKCSYLLGYDKIIYDIIQTLSSVTAKQVLTDKMCGSILNQTEHYIFYPIYHNMGYSDEKFVESINFDQLGWDKFCKAYNRAKISSIDVSNLILTLHHIILFPIDNRFKVVSTQLKHLERDLYSAFLSFKKELPNMKNMEQDQLYPLENSYRKLLEEIDIWCKKHEVR
jgi:hypothetical protein